MIIHSRNGQKLTCLIKTGFSSCYRVMDIKNEHMLFVKDPSSSLPFLSEVTMESGEKGVVLKIGDRDTTVIGMYHQMSAGSEIKVQKVEKIKDLCRDLDPKPNNVYSIDGSSLGKTALSQKNPSIAMAVKKEGKRVRINTTSPILTLC